ncbi:MAG: hypothetical protein ACKO9I_08785 [Sphaerospermopsis kisseleviana]|uniref:Uncharacterized protein n=1 Tax=Sphaerospermopsis reniformis TaxID=531300 RepID=A0A479ZWT2_9CYAN|nr:MULTISPECIES: hypothetical protein [Sphaerospermopsis]MBD2135680.1 hypothetical protein [Sphaerospermopsis sp. FACHB-1094]GCL35631.1 hypothetical protein SR1949_07280 [Sphaerospermopsis reniformis]
MVYSFTFPEEIIDSIQERIEVLERCLNDPNPQDEKMAEILELVNIQEISVIQLQEELLKLIEKFIRVRKISQVILEKSSNGEHPFNQLLLSIKQYFMMKEIIDSDSFLIINGESLKKMTIGFVEIYNQYKFQRETLDKVFLKLCESEIYIWIESLKHLLQSLIKACLRTNVFTEKEINAFNLGDITPQESEAMLISLASTKKWDYVYRKLA